MEVSMTIHGRFLLVVLILFCAYGDGRAAEYGLATNLPLSGAWVNYGAGMNNSFKLAIDQASTSGKLGDLKLRVIEGDDGGRTDQAENLSPKDGHHPSVI